MEIFCSRGTQGRLQDPFNLLMNILALILSLLAIVCLAAGNSKPDPNTRPQLEASNDEVVQQLENNQLSKDIDFADLKSILVSIEEASLMSRDKLDSLESISDASILQAYRNNALSEEYVHMANSYLAQLFKLGKPPKVQQATFDAWKDSEFSAIKLKDLIMESKAHFPDGGHCKHLAGFACIWHLNTGRFLQMNGEDSQEAKYHFSQFVAIRLLSEDIRQCRV